MKKALIIANGQAVDKERVSEELKDVSLIISVDGGARHLETLGVTPDILLGDFDSISDIEMIQSKYPKARVIGFDARKDQTDSELALEIALESECDDIVMIGVTGERLDHTFGNVFMMSRGVKRGVAVRLVDNYNVINYLEAPYLSQMTLQGKKGDLVSIIPLKENVTGIETQGLEYIVKEGLILFGSSYGLSNVMESDCAQISLKTGAVLIIKSRDME